MNKYQNLLDRQKAYFNTNITKSFEWRIEQLDKLSNLLKENLDEFYATVSKDFKTAISEQVFEVNAPLGIIEMVKGQLKNWMEPTIAPLPKFLAEAGHTAFVQRDPFGSTLIIGPFNGPILLLLYPAVTALSAGNTVVLKTSVDTPATSALLEKLIPQYFQEEAVAVVSGGVEEVTALLELPFDFIFFTGSARVGKIILRAAAENLTPVILELGGHNPAIVDETADIADAAKKIVWGATSWSGQFCASPGYAYVHESVVEQFVEEAKKAVVELYGNDPKNNPEYSSIINAAHVKRLAGLIDQTKVVAGGESDESARFVAPTILYPITWEDKIMEEEIFGPILPILTFSDLDVAIAKIQKAAKPLATYVFSTNKENTEKLLSTLSFGGGAVNMTNVQLFVASFPFGGVGGSGMGSYVGKYGYDSLTHAKPVLNSPAGAVIDHLYPPYTMEKLQALNGWFDF
ncbi:aldehyde dehydrogenase family protein [Mucilaginibacter polytrichastri]|uniref:Aldehyde dehydrogenase n=1 Tax=Mucilaginibacter polytrichastri TaxID=1302689 RepID=A0A1Q5ZY71_9SPHI|nr:aldehyde dehydrogenase family protein [Mucilaginibacter polytrichastri]OKS86706.1 putative aldehyde dehydrogenase ywdH [Mucilaginibacter polytrichastri]SFS82460.1 aldehyde dehydrogenase (NAD+) [Mucilaginibacter polytrichastri]